MYKVKKTMEKKTKNKIRMARTAIERVQRTCSSTIPFVTAFLRGS
jgi:hypothetical protein